MEFSSSRFSGAKIKDGSGRAPEFLALAEKEGILANSTTTPIANWELLKFLPESIHGAGDVVQHFFQLGMQRFEVVVQVADVRFEVILQMRQAGDRQIEIGQQIIVDLNVEKKIRNEDMHSRCGWTPFDGLTTKGWPVYTIIGGNVVMDEGVLIEKDKGTEVSYVERERKNE